MADSISKSLSPSLRRISASLSPARPTHSDSSWAAN